MSRDHKRPEAPVIVESWKPIVNDYVDARDALWGWGARRDRCSTLEDVYALLLDVYVRARNSEEKDHLWYARILYMMATRTEGMLGDSYVLDTYLTPCLAEYSIAEEEKRVYPDAREVVAAKDAYERVFRRHAQQLYYYEHRLESLSLVEGVREPEDFWFEDGLVSNVRLDGSTVTFEFDNDWRDGASVFRCEGVGSLEVDISCPKLNWVSDCGLYPSDPTSGKGPVTLDFGFLKVTCERISIVNSSGEPSR